MQKKQNQRKQKSKIKIFERKMCLWKTNSLRTFRFVCFGNKKKKTKEKNGKQKAKSNFSVNRNTNSVRFVLFRCFSFSVRKVKQKINCFCKPIFYHFCGFVKQQK